MSLYKWIKTIDGHGRQGWALIKQEVRENVFYTRNSSR